MFFTPILNTNSTSCYTNHSKYTGQKATGYEKNKQNVSTLTCPFVYTSEQTKTCVGDYVARLDANRLVGVEYYGKIFINTVINYCIIDAICILNIKC